jgi:thiosulfate reductase cytochrome b subunit
MIVKKIKKVYLYIRFERVWHWLQAFMIMVMITTEFEIHGSYTLFGFETAVEVHNLTEVYWLILFAFFVFWLWGPPQSNFSIKSM